MHSKTQDLLDRTFSFGVNTLLFLSKLKYNDVLSVPRKQLARCSVSIGANYEEAQAAETKRDFIHKIGIVCKECRESHYWLRVLKSLYSEKDATVALEKFQAEAFELRSIFSAIRIAAQKKEKSA